MARTKRPSPFLENPPSASSSSEEEEEAEEEEIEGGRETEDGSDSGSDSDHALKKKSTEGITRNGSEADSSKKPKPNVEASPKPKRAKIERVWSEEDEILIVEGLKGWRNKGKAWNKVSGVIPASSIDEFLDEIKPSLHFSPVKIAQLSTKIQKLRKRYFTSMKNRNDGDEDPVFSKPHDYRMYLIMKDIWGEVYTKMRGNGVNVNASGVDDTVEVGVDDDNDNDGVNDGNVRANWELLDNLPVLGINECLLKEGLRLIGDSEVKKLEKKWKELQQEELVVYMRRMDLMKETTEAVLGAMKSSKD